MPWRKTFMDVKMLWNSGYVIIEYVCVRVQAVLDGNACNIDKSKERKNDSQP